MRPSSPSRRFAFVAPALVALVAASCSSTATGTTTSTTFRSATTASTSPVALSACTGGSADIPAGATDKQVIDLDGDGRPDTAWVFTGASGVTTVGVATAAGGGTRRTWNSASPVMRSVLVVDVNDSTPPLFLADDGRMVQLWAFENCAIADVINAQGNPYEFSLGFTEYGTGVGCATIDGVRRLVGLNVTDQTDSTVDWSSTVVNVTGTEARNGTVTTGTFTIPADNAAIDLLHTVACGGQTIADDGISAQE
ncbi:MAG: hypothetical protein WAM81_02990 [Acidimicrobiia bacterium]